MGALLDIAFGLIWAGGGIGDFRRPEPPVAGLILLTGVSSFILGIALVATLLWRMGLALRGGPNSPWVKATAKSLAGIALFLIALGAMTDLARGDGALIGAVALAVFNGPSLVAGLLLLLSRN